MGDVLLIASAIAPLQIAQLSLEGEHLVSFERKQELYARHIGKLCCSARREATEFVQLDSRKQPQLASKSSFIGLLCEKDRFRNVENDLPGAHVNDS